MASETLAVKTKNLFPHLDDFSLVLGGPLFQLLRRSHLSGDALELLRRRIILGALLAWLPLFILSTLEGNALGGNVAVPFLMSVEVHVRFLVALPLFIIAELVVHQRLISIVRQFDERDLIPEKDRPRFERAINSALELRNSVLAEVLLILFVYGVGVLIIWRKYIALHNATWYAVPADSGMRLSLAGMWYMFVSVPFFQFLLLRWYFRIFIWARFLWQAARLELTLVPTHPDRLGGLGFLANTVFAFAPLLTAHGAMLAGLIANRIFHLGAKLTDFKLLIAAFVIVLLGVVVGPLLVFAPRLMETKRKGSREYGWLAQRYVREFDTKWLRGGAAADDSLLGSADIQSLADLNNSYEAVRSMRFLPVTWDAIVQLIGAILAPLAPLVLTIASLEELLDRLVGILF
jgi:hypothetical protein